MINRENVLLGQAIVIGPGLICIGWHITNNKPISKPVGQLIMAVGLLATLYHGSNAYGLLCRNSLEKNEGFRRGRSGSRSKGNIVALVAIPAGVVVFVIGLLYAIKSQAKRDSPYPPT